MTTSQKRLAARSAIAARVRSKAAEHRVSVRSLAEAAGLDYSAMLRRTRGEVDFTVPDLVATADALGISVAELLPVRPQAVAS